MNGSIFKLISWNNVLDTHVMVFPDIQRRSQWLKKPDNLR